MDLDKVLITGGQSRIGQEIDFGVKLDHKQLDITDRSSINAALEKYKPSAVLNLASLDLRMAQADPLLANKVNVVGVYNLAIETAKRGIPLIVVSSGAVFNGSAEKDFSENDIPDPLNVYGQGKYLAELVAQLNPKHFVVRTGWLIGFTKKVNFFNGMLNNAREGKALMGTTDQYGSITYIHDFISGLKDVLDGDNYGVYHIANSGRATAYDLAERLVSSLQSKSIITKASVAEGEAKSGIMRSRSEVLVSDKVKLRDWKEALEDCLFNLS